MQNLTVENLSKTFDLGDATGLMGPGNPSQVASEKRVVQEMMNNGMEPPAAVGHNGSTTTFSDLLRKSVDNVNQMQVEADTAVKELVAGRSKNIHETMLAVERADISLKLMMQVRNKIIDAYREVMRMQV